MTKVQDHFFDKAPGFIRPLIVWMVRRQIQKTLQGQGLGRHTEPEFEILARKDFAAASALLGEKPYLLGEVPCGYDTSFLSFINAALCRTFDHPISNTASEFPNLSAYCQRMRKQYLQD